MADPRRCAIGSAAATPSIKSSLLSGFPGKLLLTLQPSTTYFPQQLHPDKAKEAALCLLAYYKTSSLYRRLIHPSQPTLSLSYTQQRTIQSTTLRKNLPTQPDNMSSAQQTVKNITKVQPRPTTFLSLAPETSASYPTAQATSPAPLGIARRSSSVSSTGSLRVLKLGPVHWGEHPGAHKEDFYEVAVE
ncbi:hypothetical protein HD806DRAFT_543200 [Xylariaceae sp. AK1471]|nr:hypothetical protein HD806DRAFT_543200 [Xylariaceae sp. AK1471]